MTAEFPLGQHIGDYEVLSILGLGGFRSTYENVRLFDALGLMMPFAVREDGRLPASA